MKYSTDYSIKLIFFSWCKSP